MTTCTELVFNVHIYMPFIFPLFFANKKECNLFSRANHIINFCEFYSETENKISSTFFVLQLGLLYLFPGF